MFGAHEIKIGKWILNVGPVLWLLNIYKWCRRQPRFTKSSYVEIVEIGAIFSAALSLSPCISLSRYFFTIS